MRLNWGILQRNWLINVAIALVWFLLAELATVVLKLGAEPSPVWFPAGFGLAALLLYGPGVWVGLTAGAWLFGVTVGVTWPAVLVAAISSSFGALVGRFLLARLGFQMAFRSLHDVLGFVILAVVLSPVVNATISTLNAVLAHLSTWNQFGMHWWTVWLGDAMGILVITPLLLTWSQCAPRVRPSLRSLRQAWKHSVVFRRQILEVLVWTVLLVSVSWVVFHSPAQTDIVYYPLEYLPFPLIIWAALRLGQRSTVLSSLIVSGIAIWGVSQDVGPFLAKSGGDARQAIFLLQTFVGVITATALVLAAAVAERQQAEELLRKSEASLLNAQRIAQLGNWDMDLPPCCAGGEGVIAQMLPTLRWSDELYRILGLTPQSVAPSLEVFWQVVHPDDRERVQQAVYQAMTQRLPYNLDYRILLPNGCERLVNEQVEVNATSITGTVQDITARTQAEVALRESEARFRGMFEGAAIGIGLDNLQGQVIESNPALQAMLGYSREELHQMSFADFSHPADLNADTELFQEMVAGRLDSYQMEKRHIRKEGEVVWVRLSNSLVRDAAGNPKFTIGMVENITERKQAEEALQQSEARFRVVAETAPCAFLVYQGNHLRYVNPATETITEYSREELLAMNFWMLAHPEFREVVQHRGLARQRGEVVPHRYEIKILTKTGRERWVDFTAGVIHYEGEPAGMATAYDITDRKQAEAKLLLAANRERLLSEIALRIRRSLNLDEILNTTVAEVRRFLQADRVFITHIDETGYSRTVAESVDPHWASILDWVGDREAVREIKHLFECDSAACRIGSRQIRVVNDTHQVETTPLQAEYYERCQVRAGIGVSLMLDGKLFGLLIVNQCSEPRQWQPLEIDLLEQLATQVEIAIQQGQLYRQVQTLANNLERQVEERTAELQQRMQELQTLNQVKDLLLHAVSHDLRTPVQGTLMVLNRLRSKCSEAIPISRSMLDLMIQSSEHQLQLLNSLMEKHCTPKPEMPMSYEPTCLAHVLQTALHNLEPLLHQNQASVANQLRADLPLVKGDPTQLQQVFEHLLSNAVKHNPPGVAITLSADVRDVSDPQQAEANPKRLYCSVRDDGVGMTQEQCDRLFQLYVRGMDNRHLTGIGLGLHHCRQIITAHGGNLGVESQPGKGATFWFTLPLYHSSA